MAYSIGQIPACPTVPFREKCAGRRPGIITYAFRCYPTQWTKGGKCQVASLTSDVISFIALTFCNFIKI